MQRAHKHVAASVGEMGDSRSQVQLVEERAVLVEELPRDMDTALELKLQIHFQSKQKSGGGECLLLSHPGSKRKAIVQFTSQKVRDSVLAKGQHVIEVANGEKVAVCVTAFVASPVAPAEPGAPIEEKSKKEDLQTSSNDKCEESGKAKGESIDKQEHLKALNETLNPHLLGYLMSNEEHWLDLEKTLQKHGCKIKMVDFETVSFLPDNESTNHNEWQGLVTKVFRKFTEAYSHETINCTENEWKEVEAKNKQNKGVQLLHKNGIQLTGQSDDVERVKKQIEDIIKELRQEKLLMDLEPRYFDLLQDELSIRFPAVQCEMYSKSLQLCLKGDSRKVQDVKKYIDDCVQNSDQKKCSFGNYLNTFLRNTDLQALVKMHFIANKIKALCSFDENEIYIYSLQGYAEKAYDILNNILKDLLIPVTQSHAAIMKSEQWDVFFKQLEQTFSDRKHSCIFSTVKRTDGTCSAINIAGISEAVEMADKELTRYFNENIGEEIINLHNESLCKCILEFMKIVDHPALKSVAVEMHNSLTDIVIMGHRDEVDKQKQSVNNAVSRINIELEINERGVPDEERISGLLERYKKRNSSRLTGFKEEFPSEAGASKRSFATQDTPTVNLPGNRCLFVQEKDILVMNVDVIVNAANEDLRHLGGLAKVLSDAAGREFQHQSDLYIRKHGQVRTGEVAMTGPGQLPFRKVFHAVGPEWCDSFTDKPTKIKLLETVITNVLKKADEERFKSIAIPAISAGIFAFPLDICTRAICKAIFEYCTRTQKNENTLTDIYIVDVNHTFISKMRKTIELTVNGTGTSEDASSNINEMQDEQEEGDRNKEVDNSHYDTEDRTDWGKHKGKDDCSFEINDIEMNSFITHEGRRIQLVNGNIEDQRTDIIVNSISMQMKLDDGRASAALLRKAGPALQAEFNRKKKLSSRFVHGDIISTDTSNCNLSCKNIYHIVGQPVEKKKESVYKTVLDCLKKAHKNKERSISFPALGTGGLNYPPHHVARDMLSAAIQFSKEHKDDVLQLIQLVILRTNPDICKAFQNEISNVKSDTFVEATAPNRKQNERFQTGAVHSERKWKVKGITVELCCGDITQEATDAIVNSTDTAMSMTKGVSNAILQAAGRSIKDEFLRERPKFGDIVVTKAGHLKCKNIVHIAGLTPRIEDACTQILTQCHLRKLKSVSFPAFGTGVAGKSPDDVVFSMVGAIHAFTDTFSKPTVTNIRFVCFDKGLLDSFQNTLTQILA